jgi:hypothetical protein
MIACPYSPGSALFLEGENGQVWEDDSEFASSPRPLGVHSHLHPFPPSSSFLMFLFMSSDRYGGRSFGVDIRLLSQCLRLFE